MQGGVSLFPVETFFMHFCECLDFGQTEASNPDESVIMHSVSVVNFTVILSPPFFFFCSDVTF